MHTMRSPLGIVAALVLLHIGLFVWFSSFTADDAFIVYRYAENLASGDGLVFNKGERINALTSPLHALVCSGLFALTGNTVWSNRLVAVVFHLSSTCYAATRLGPRHGRLLFFVLTWLSPYLVLWAAGGLETLYLSSFITLAFAVASRTPTAGVFVLAAFSTLVGLAFVTRYDSCLFTLPLWLHVATATLREQRASKSLRSTRLAALLLPGLVIATAWLATSQVYYRDIFPTSIYHKPLRLGDMKAAMVYIAQFLVVSGLVPLLVWGLLGRGRRAGRFAEGLSRTARANLGAVSGLALFFAYATTTALTHMMFAYRQLLPYLPVLALLSLQLIHRASPSGSDSGDERRRRWSTPTVLLALLQAAQLYILDSHSLNPGLTGEYRQLSRRDYVRFTSTLARQADDIDKHWNGLNRDRAPRIHAYAAGVVSHRLRDASIVDWGLVSFRRRVTVHARHRGLLYSSDYVLTLSPKLGPVRRQLQRRAEALRVVTETDVHFDGSEQKLSVYYNPQPLRYRLPTTVDGPPLDPVPGPLP